MQESPHAFLSTYEREASFDARKWQEEFSRGDWKIGYIDGAPACLLGITREPGAPAHECHLEYLWVPPAFRRGGVALRMLSDVIAGLRDSEVRTVYLWVLDGNYAAMRLYKRVGFVSSDHRQPLEAQPERYEERMQLQLRY